MESAEHEMQQEKPDPVDAPHITVVDGADRGVQPGGRRPIKEADGMTATKPYGSWPSPITAASVVEGSRGLSSLSFDGDYLYWVESRPEEGGRNTIMRWRTGGEPEEILPAPWYARTRVQEYGGRCVLVANGTVWFSNFEDQRLYRLVPGNEPEAITPAAELRYAGCIIDRSRNRLICVREDHRVPGEPRNTLVALPLNSVSEGEVLFDSSDFVSAPSVSPDGSRIAFTSWRHPNMPWDNTSLWSAGFDADGRLEGLTLHNDGMQESVINPQWGEDKQLYAISDRDNWWKIYRVVGDEFAAIDSGIERAEIGGPDWVVGQNFYHLLADGKILAQVMTGGVEQAIIINPATSSSTPLGLASASIIDMLPVDDRATPSRSYAPQVTSTWTATGLPNISWLVSPPAREPRPTVSTCHPLIPGYRHRRVMRRRLSSAYTAAPRRLVHRLSGSTSCIGPVAASRCWI
jgi:hypothetical protein